jgi:hypothetical protein
MNKLAIRNVNEYSLPSYLAGVPVSGDTLSVFQRCLSWTSLHPAQFAIGCESLHNVKQVRLKEINLEPTLSQDRVLMHVTWLPTGLLAILVAQVSGPIVLKLDLPSVSLPGWSKCVLE